MKDSNQEKILNSNSALKQQLIFNLFIFLCLFIVFILKTIIILILNFKNQ